MIASALSRTQPAQSCVCFAHNVPCRAGASSPRMTRGRWSPTARCTQHTRSVQLPSLRCTDVIGSSRAWAVHAPAAAGVLLLLLLLVVLLVAVACSRGEWLAAVGGRRRRCRWRLALEPLEARRPPLDCGRLLLLAGAAQQGRRGQVERQAGRGGGGGQR